MASQWLKARQTKYAAYATTYILVVIAVIVVANVLADRHHKSFDATSNKRYSLSDQTAKIVKGLKQGANITYFNQSTRFRDGKDLLDQYANLSPKVRVEYVDPDKEPQRAREAGIKNFGTAVVQVGAKKEEAKSMTEEGITGAFIRDLKSNTRTVCFVTGSGEHQIDNSDREGLSRFKDLVAKDNYESKSVDLLQKADVPSDCTTLVIAGPTRNYEQPEVDAIKKYVEAGGRAFEAGPLGNRRQRCARKSAPELGSDDEQRPDPRFEPHRADRRTWSPGSVSHELQRSAHRERNERDCHWFSAGPVNGNQERWQDHR